ncbi:MAG: isopropylmalate/homocitrate/citramalate synthase [Novosphingobium sp. 28-62-57]|uniref:ketosteroid isomerase-related protein n=1 Tax=unclassified Novosphingobium TaxID=2644732 RepID=UPI000BD952A9|nr:MULTISPECIES: ketosteroid isomerase-related protein [unclassified Novosphingobium]OYW51196.1 MAG: isopropylmalate/homocitrate/citramalate synthase [Novosphingobium sp. 12-62-10]OYZ11200.1 MAG: isopropylmalate/homocitrate/citramalate synthase [Novosphingobium sp. 28-62-57]HQS68770.1 ketosteroid isomerase-related protein [Novosphingobium sp.]
MTADAARTDTIALMQRYYSAFNAGDWQGMLDCLSDDVAHDINQGERVVGKAAFAQFLGHMERCYKERLEDIVLMASDDGKRGAAEFVVHGAYLSTDEGLPEASGQTYVLPAGAFLAIEGGKIARLTMYYNLADWTKQVVG